MRSLLRRAFEAEQDDLVMKGPLAGNFTEALMREFSNQAPEGAALETAAMDQTVMAAMVDQLVSQVNPSYNTTDPTTVYSVDPATTTPETYSEVACDLVNCDHPANYVVAFHDTATNALDGNERLAAGMESMVKALGGTFYRVKNK